LLKNTLHKKRQLTFLAFFMLRGTELLRAAAEPRLQSLLIHSLNKQTMASILQQNHAVKARELGISEEIISCALNLIYQNRNLVNAIDNRVEMDDYIYRAVLKQAVDRRRRKAEEELDHPDAATRGNAEKDLSLLKREELVTDPFYRAVLPLITKVVVNEPVLRLHAEEASAMVLELADIKRKHRATSLTEIIVKRCVSDMEDAD
jgi:hypothetical protein